MRVQIPRLNAAGAVHALSQIAGLAAGSGAHIQHLHTGADGQRQRGEHAALALDAEAAGLEVRVLRQIGGAVDDVSIGSLSLFPLPYLAVQQLFKGGMIQLHQVGAQGRACLALTIGDDGLGGGVAVVGNELMHQPLGHGEHHGEELLGLLRLVGVDDLVPAADEVAEDGVAYAAETLKTRILAQRHGGVHGGAFRNLVVEEDLARAQPQDDTELRLGVLFLQEFRQRPVQPHLVVEGVVDQTGG